MVLLRYCKGWCMYYKTMFRRYGSTSFRNETVPKHRVNTKISKRQKRRRYKAKQSEAVSLHYFHRNGTAPFLASKPSETHLNSDLSITKTLPKQRGTVTPEHCLNFNSIKWFFSGTNCRKGLSYLSFSKSLKHRAFEKVMSHTDDLNFQMSLFSTIATSQIKHTSQLQYSIKFWSHTQTWNNILGFWAVNNAFSVTFLPFLATLGFSQNSVLCL